MTYRWRNGEVEAVTEYAPYVMRPFQEEENASGWHWSPEARQAVTEPFNPAYCGTPKGYRQHRKYDQTACQPCKDAAAKDNAAIKARAKARAEAEC